MSAGDTRQRILAEFARQFVAGGYLGVSLDQLAKAVNIKKPSLYHHFPDGKLSMYMEVANAYIDDNAHLLRAAIATPGQFVDRLTALASIFADPRHQGSTMGERLFDATRYLSEEARSDVSHRYVENLITPVVDLMTEAVASGELRQADPSFLAWAFLELAAVVEPMPEDVAMPPAERGGGCGPDPDLPRAVADLFLNGAATPNGPRRGGGQAGAGPSR